MLAWPICCIFSPTFWYESKNLATQRSIHTASLCVKSLALYSLEMHFEWQESTILKRESVAFCVRLLLLYWWSPIPSLTGWTNQSPCQVLVLPWQCFEDWRSVDLAYHHRRKTLCSCVIKTSEVGFFWQLLFLVPKISGGTSRSITHPPSHHLQIQPLIDHYSSLYWLHLWWPVPLWNTMLAWKCVAWQRKRTTITKDGSGYTRQTPNSNSTTTRLTGIVTTSMRSI